MLILIYECFEKGKGSKAAASSQQQLNITLSPNTEPETISKLKEFVVGLAWESVYT
jgi:hypothetical protein